MGTPHRDHGRPAWLPRTVVVFGLVSFMNDTASEMITPILPIFLTTALGAGPAAVGLIEGLAEATSSVLKLVSGRMADRGGRHKRWVLSGYGLSNAARPLIGAAGGWLQVLLLRFLDRAGKGMRTSPRDALVSSAVETRARGRAFGFHRAMDHLGAVLGPIIAFALLTGGVTMGHVFLLSIVPGMAVIGLLLWGLPDMGGAPARAAPRLAWGALDGRLRALVLSAGGLAFATVPDAFLLLWANQRGMTIAWVPLLWSAAHAVRSVTAGLGGLASDRAGRLPVVAAGWAARACLLALLPWAPVGSASVWVMFLAYAATTASTEGAERAMVGDLAPESLRGTAFGFYHLVSGIMALPGALLFGGIWQWFGMQGAFLAAAGLTLAAAAVFVVLSRVIDSPSRN